MAKGQDVMEAQQTSSCAQVLSYKPILRRPKHWNHGLVYDVNSTAACTKPTKIRCHLFAQVQSDVLGMTVNRDQSVPIILGNNEFKQY